MVDLKKRLIAVDLEIWRILAGIILLSIGAGVAFLIGSVLGINELLLAIVVGFVVSNIVDIPEFVEPGLKTHNYWLEFGIILMGSSLTIATVFDAGATVLLAVGIMMVLAITVAEFLSRDVFGLTERLGSLLAAGSSICGVSAIVAVGGSIQAKQEQIAYAVATILLFDGMTIVLYPYIGKLLELPDTVFGIWAGVSMFSTGPVVAVGFAYSDVAGQWATVTKLTRNALIGLIVIGYATYYTRKEMDGSVSLSMLWEDFPTFVLGFIAMMFVASTGVLSSYQATIQSAYNWLFMVAFIGLGTEIQVAKLRRTGFMPVVLVSITFAFVSLFSLVLIMVLL